jgi:5-formyltetrahydrofolate cyclo-ligase
MLPRIPDWEAFTSVLLFCSMKTEIDTGPLAEVILSAGKSLFFPRVAGADMGFYRSPLGQDPAEDLPLSGKDFPALILCPGLAFDRKGRRLGRGRGCYDRFFAALDSGRLGADGEADRMGTPASALPYSAFGLCLTRQLIDAVPVEAHDKIMDGVLTGEKLILIN